MIYYHKIDMNITDGNINLSTEYNNLSTKSINIF